MDLLNISKQDFKSCEETKVLVFDIEIDTTTFTARLPQNKLEKAIKKTGKVLYNCFGSIFYFDI